MDSTNGEITQHGTSEVVEQPSISDDLEVEVNGEKIPLSELKNGYMRQSDYTRKTQELKKTPDVQPQNEDPDTAAAEQRMEQFLEKKGYVKSETLTKREQEQQLTMATKDMIRDNPTLKSYELVIKELVEKTGKHPADIVEQYLPDVDKVIKAKQANGSIMWSSEKSRAEFKDMTPAQKAKWYEENRESIKNAGNKFTVTGSI